MRGDCERAGKRGLACICDEKARPVSYSVWRSALTFILLVKKALTHFNSLAKGCGKICRVLVRRM